MAKGKESQKLIANNKKAYHDFFIDETYECGIALHGTEVKSMRMGKCSIKEAFVRIEDGEVFVYGMHVSPYEKGNIFNKDPLRVKKLLLHKYEINKLLGKIKEKGYTLVPLQVYFKDGKVKALAVKHCRIRACGSQIADLEFLLCLSALILFGNGFSLVIELLTTCQPDLYLYLTVFKVYLQRD